MLTEEALILLSTLGASGLLVLGVVELVWPARPRRAGPRRTRGASSDPIVTRRLEAARTVAITAAATEEPPIPTDSPRASADLDAATEIAPTFAEDEGVPMLEPSSASVATVIEEERPQERPSPPIVAPPRPSVETRPQVLPIDTCRTMYEEGRFAEVVSLGSAALEVHAGLAAVSHRPHEASALLDLVGLAKHALGDHAGARAALEAAVVGADPATRSSCARHLVAVVRAFLGQEPAKGADTTYVRELRACLISLDRALSVAPDDADAGAARASVRDALSRACERLASQVGAGGMDHDAQELVLGALADSEMPPALRERLRDELTAASSAEIGQLTAQAIRSVQEGKDGEALEALQRAERLSQALPTDAVTEERREEFERRLWWGYSKVGLRRIETQSYESALEPLFRALRFGSADDERAAETRGAVVRALEGVVETSVSEVARRGGADPQVALAEIERLSELLQVAGERGVQPEELADLFAAVRGLHSRVSPAA